MTKRSSPEHRRARRGSPVLRLAVALAAGMVAAPALAQSVWESFPLPKSDWALFSGVTVSDNVTRSPEKVSDQVLSVGGTGAFFRDEGRLRANVRGSAWYEHYLQDTYDGELLGSLAAFLRYDLIPERISWTLEDTYGQTTSNQFQPATPGNRSNANFFSTGPDFTLRLGQASGLRLGGRYELSTFEDGQQLDEERVRATAGLFRRLSGTTTVSLNASASQTDYRNGEVQLGDGQSADGYDIREGYARAELRRARYTLSVDGGVTQVEQKGVQEESPLLRLSFYRRLTPSLNLNLSGGQEYRSGGDILRDSIQGVRFLNNQVIYIPPGVDPAFVFNVIQDLNARSQPVKYEFANGSLDLVRPRTTFSVSGGAGRERFQFSGQNLDRDVWNGSVRVAHRLRPNVSATAAVNYYDRQFINLVGGDRTVAGVLQLQWQYTSQIAFNAGYRYERRNADFAEFSYRENMLYVGFTYGRAKPSSLAPPTGSTTPAATGPLSTQPTTPTPAGTGPRPVP
jgi:hypothetical protein